MRKLGGKLAILACTLGAGPVALATEHLVFDTRGNLGSAENYCQQTDHPPCKAARSAVREFANGNTFVQIDSKLANEDVLLLLPEELSADTWMEVLLKIHVAHSSGARSVEVSCTHSPRVSEEGQTLIADADLRDMLAKAGADSLQINGQLFDLHAIRYARPRRQVFDPAMKTSVISLHHNELGTAVAKQLNLAHVRADEIREDDLPQKAQVLLISAAVLPTNRSLFQALTLARKLKSRGNRVLQIVPYFPYSRSDKIDQPGVSVGGKLIADLYQSSGADLLGFVNLHAPQAQGFFDIPTIHINTHKPVAEILRQLKIDGVVSPDAGFQKEATLYATQVGLPVYVLNKQRDPRTGDSKLQAMGEFDIAGKVLALIDDETSTGKTQVLAAEYLLSNGAAGVYTFVTHLAGSADALIGHPAVKAIYVFDTFPIRAQGPQMRPMSIASEIARSLSDFVHACPHALEIPK